MCVIDLDTVMPGSMLYDFGDALRMEGSTPAELKLLPLSVKLMTYECGIRFLTDYLNGDTYFKIHREHHNLDRARNQFKLVADLTNKDAMLNEITIGLA